MQETIKGEWFDYCFPRYYRRFNAEAFGQLIQDVRERRLPVEEFQYIVLGCGYLFCVRKLDPENYVREKKREMGERLGLDEADLLLDEKAMLKRAKQFGLTIGPENRLLAKTRRPGPSPDPAPRIAALVIDRWVPRQGLKVGQRLDPTPWACDLHFALSYRRLQPATFERMRKRADTARVKLWPGIREKDPPEDVPAIDYLLTMFRNRYQRFKQEGFPLTSFDDTPGILYPIGGVLDPVLKAVDMQVEVQGHGLAELFQKPGRT